MELSRKGDYCMKKLLTLICMITCLLGLTACAKTDQSEYDQSKLSYAQQSAAPQAIALIQAYMDEATIAAMQQYTAEEVEYILSAEQSMNVNGYAFMNGLDSFLKNSQEIGGIVSIGEATAVIDKSQIVVTVAIMGKDKNAKAEIIFSNDMFMALEGASLNPEYSLGEIMGKAGLNTLIGMGTVFAVLILIIMVISLFRYIPKITEAFSKKESEEEIRSEGIDKAVSLIVEQEESTEVGQSAEEGYSVEEAENMELVAVIAAAIAAGEGAVTTEGFVVRSIRKVNRSRQ